MNTTISSTPDFCKEVLLPVNDFNVEVPEGRIPVFSINVLTCSFELWQKPAPGYTENVTYYDEHRVMGFSGKFYQLRLSDIARAKASIAKRVDLILEAGSNGGEHWYTAYFLKKYIEKIYSVAPEHATDDIKWDAYLTWMKDFYSCGRYRHRQILLWNDMIKDFDWGKDDDIYLKLTLRIFAFEIGSALGNVFGD